MNKHTPLPDLKFGVYMCKCCEDTLGHNDPVVNDFGEMCCPHTGQYLTEYYWNSDAIKGWVVIQHDNEDFGWCLECGESYLPEHALTDNFGNAVCCVDSEVLVSYDIAYLDGDY